MDSARSIAKSGRLRRQSAPRAWSHLLDRKPKELSGGPAAAGGAGPRAGAHGRSLCLFDEPLSNLDAALRGQMRAEIKKLHEETGATFVYVTHDQTEAMTLSDRVVILDRGVSQQIAPPREIYDRPANVFVAGFIGAPPINLLAPATLGLEGKVRSWASVPRT